MSITSSRFAMVVGPFHSPRTTEVHVWNWRMGIILLVRESLASVRSLFNSNSHGQIRKGQIVTADT